MESGSIQMAMRRTELQRMADDFNRYSYAERIQFLLAAQQIDRQLTKRVEHSACQEATR